MKEDIKRLIVSGSSLRVSGGQAESRGFCPTGPGGGIDNSCSSKGGGGGGAISKSGLKAGMKVTITKKGAKTSTTGVVKSVSHEGKKSVVTFENGKSVTIYDKATIQAEAAHAQATGQPPSTKVAAKVPDTSKNPDPSHSKTPPPKDTLQEIGWKETPLQQRDSVQEAIVNTPTAREAIKLYSQSAYQQLNDSLRKNGSESDSFSDAAAAAGGKMNAAMMGALDVATQIEHSSARVTYRGMHPTTLDGVQLTQKFADMNVGWTFVDTGFASTSRSPERAAGFSSDGGVIMRVTSRFGLPMEDISFHKGEKEVLQPRNLRYRLTGKKWAIGPDGSRQLHVDVEAVEIVTKWGKK